MKKKELTIGSNGYYFVDMVAVPQSEFYQIKISQQLDDIEEEIKAINKNYEKN